MANYAVIEDGLVTNIVVADSQAIAEELTGFGCAEYTDENPIGIGWAWDNTANKYIAPQPYPSWTYDYNAGMWEAPVEMPEEEGKGFNWDEATQSWVSFDLILGE
jgi:hypothetical protein